jgi:hypothetical protein
MKAQGIDRTKLVYHNRFQPFVAWWGLGWNVLFILINGFEVFWSFNASDFLTAYINIPIFIGLYIIWKFVKKTKFWKPEGQHDSTNVSSMLTNIHRDGFHHRRFFWRMLQMYRYLLYTGDPFSTRDRNARGNTGNNAAKDLRKGILTSRCDAASTRAELSAIQRLRGIENLSRACDESMDCDSGDDIPTDVFCITWHKRTDILNAKMREKRGTSGQH